MTKQNDSVENGEVYSDFGDEFQCLMSNDYKTEFVFKYISSVRKPNMKGYDVFLEVVPEEASQRNYNLGLAWRSINSVLLCVELIS